jgi:hypothetical protein
VAFANVLLVSGSANFSTRDVWDGYRVALEAAGIRVIPYPTFSFLKVLSVDAVCNDIIGTALDVANGIDSVVFVDGLYFRGLRARVPQSLKRAGIPTVLIATDDPYEQMPNLEDLYTYRFTNEIRCVRQGVDYLPTATLPLPEVPRIRHPRYDVSFLGTVFEDRLPLLVKIAEFCEARQRRFLVAGKIVGDSEPFKNFTCTELRQRTIDTLEKWEIYSQSRLSLNLFRKCERPADSPSPRVFEVTAFGQAALVTGPRRSEVTRLYGDSVYHFDDAGSAVAAIEEALRDDATRLEKVSHAREITLREHLYEHRAQALITQVREAERERVTAGAAEERVAWIIGCGRTGSTWLAEMLGDLPKIRRWHEPYFGRLLRHIHDHPEDLERRASFFSRRHQAVWLEGVRDLFFKMVRDRFPQFGRHSLVVKEVNTPELYPWLRTLFPTARLLLLVRDPFDILDSYLDLQKPGSWNQTFGEPTAERTRAMVRQTAEHIRSTMTLALATFENFPLEQRHLVSYEEMLRDPVAPLVACGRLISVTVKPADARAVAGKHAFDKYEKTGPGQFRRQARAGGWKSSEHFTPETLEIAAEVLGPLRERLGYADAPPVAPPVTPPGERPT